MTCGYGPPSAHLREDAAYLKYADRRSRYPLDYLFAYQAYGSCPVSNCNRSFHTGRHQVDASNDLQDAVPSRVWNHGANRIETPLYGTAPYRARGDGEMLAIDASNSLVRGSLAPKHCGRSLAEVETLRWDNNDLPNAVEGWRRGGVPTRGGPQYLQPTFAASLAPR